MRSRSVDTDHTRILVGPASAYVARPRTLGNVPNLDFFVLEDA